MARRAVAYRRRVASSGGSKVVAITVYTVLRVALFAAVWLTLELLTPIIGLWAIVLAILISGAISIVLLDRREEEDGYETPIGAVGEWATYVCRVRDDPTVENGLAMWIVADDLRNGSAMIAVQCAELLLNKGAFSAALKA